MISLIDNVATLANGTTVSTQVGDGVTVLCEFQLIHCFCSKTACPLFYLRSHRAAGIYGSVSSIQSKKFVKAFSIDQK